MVLNNSQTKTHALTGINLTHANEVRTVKAPTKPTAIVMRLSLVVRGMKP